MGCIVTDRELTTTSKSRRILTFLCDICWDSGFDAKGHDCFVCDTSRTSAASNRLAQVIADLEFKNVSVDPTLFAMARALVSSSVYCPFLGEDLANVLHCSPRELKRTAKRLRDEWYLPVVGRREKPYGYFLASTAEEFLDWMRVTRGQAISELATAYRLFRTNFPALAGQRPLLFVGEVSDELTEAIK